MSLENINKIASFLKVNPGKLGYNADKIITRESKSNEILSGYTTVILSMVRESKTDIGKTVYSDLETQCLISQWIDYSGLFISNTVYDKTSTHILLKELNTYLSTRSYLVANGITLADVVAYYSIQKIMLSLSHLEKEQYLNVSRWYNHLQQNKALRQDNNAVNFSTTYLFGWVTGKHM